MPTSQPLGRSALAAPSRRLHAERSPTCAAFEVELHMSRRCPSSKSTPHRESPRTLHTSGSHLTQSPPSPSCSPAATRPPLQEAQTEHQHRRPWQWGARRTLRCSRWSAIPTAATHGTPARTEAATTPPPATRACYASCHYPVLRGPPGTWDGAVGSRWDGRWDGHGGMGGGMDTVGWVRSTLDMT